MAALAPHGLEKDGLVAERVGGIVVDVVQAEQIVVEKAGRPGAGKHMVRADVLEEAIGALLLIDALLLGERLLHVVGKIVDERIPDRAGELSRRVTPDGGDPLLQRAMEELLTAIEELEVSDEELRAQNESLAAGQLMLDTERQRYADLFHLAPEPTW